MSDFKDVPTEQLLSFQEFTPVHEATYSSAQLNVDLAKQEQKTFDDYNINVPNDNVPPLDDVNNASTVRSFWSLEFYQQLFDVNTNDVLERIVASFLPRRDSLFKSKVKLKPDLYGPLWISITLVFMIAITGNIANYLVSANTKYHWRYNFHLVSYAATAIYSYIGIVPVALWALLKWSSNDEADDMQIEENATPNILELICIYGYSLFIYVPISILWSIQIAWLQWILVIIAALLSGTVLLYTLMPSLRRSKHQLFLIIGVSACHLLLAAGFMLYFFHIPQIETPKELSIVTNKTIANM